MPRHARIHAPGVVYHIIVRGDRGREIYLRDGDRRQFLTLIRNTRNKYPFTLYSYVLMENHFHLLMQVGEMTTARIMQSLLTSYSRYFNRAHGRRGRLFQARYKAVLCDKEAYLRELLRYLHLNPLRAGLAARPDGWEWSSHDEYRGLQGAGLIEPGIMRELFGQGAAGHRKYCRFLEEGSARVTQERFYPGESNPFLGLEEIRKRAGGAPRPRKRSLEEIAGRIAKESGAAGGALLRKTKQRKISRMRKLFIGESVREGFMQSEIARYLGCDQSYVSRNAQKSARIP